MIRLIEALNFRNLNYIRQPVHNFQVLIGTNGSGKSNFLDILSFLGRFISKGAKVAITERSNNFRDLTWRRNANRFELAIEAEIPPEHRRPLDSPEYDIIRYEFAIGITPENQDLISFDEQITLIQQSEMTESAVSSLEKIPDTVFVADYHQMYKQLIAYDEKGNLLLYPEESFENQGCLTSDNYLLPNRLEPNLSVFCAIQAFENEFPAANWLVRFLTQSLFQIRLDSSTMRQLSRYGQEFLFTEYGAKLHWVIERIKKETPDRFVDWLTQIKSLMPDLEDIVIHERPDDRKKIIAIRYNDGFEIPSGLMSEGLLRLLALTSLPYFPDKGYLCIIEEPENNLHPLALEIVIRNLRSNFSGQIIMTTYSPFALGLCHAHEVLIFSADSQHGAQITSGSQHPGISYNLADSGLKTLFEMGELN